MSPRNTPDETAPDAVAVAALGWIAKSPDMLGRFLALTGIEAAQIREAASEPGFLAGVLDFVLAHEPTLTAFCEDSGIAPAQVQKARRSLGSGDEDAWLLT
ncbi:DUF3572 domain-containing protein [Oricola cellulosilytica]|uniref:DUF3572 family protein n=1 Tax=Oricola cellulosilytica TaxID=1429082 RepID=A0A4R0PDR5_9HYPH|nr:DUF3572 domain-containing protein [Oricola cellulosilytica]TCD14469.1 DUF3572 family protein [Oricola cellulosilytica]